MRPLPRLGIVLVLVSVLFISLPTAAQPADQDAQAIVLEAFENLQALEGYHFTLTTNTHTHIERDDEVVDNYFTLEAEGDALANGDYHIATTRVSGETPEEAQVNPTLEIEYTAVDGDLYVNLLTEDTDYEEVFGVEPGWWEHDTLIAQLDTAGTAFVIDSLAPALLLPSNLPLEATLIDSVTEAPAETVDGLAMRVFEVGFYAPAFFVAQSGASLEEQLNMMLRDQALLAASELSFSLRLWIGADDGLLYRGEFSSSTFLPYATIGAETSGPDYDIATDTTMEFVVTGHGEAGDIAPPAARELNR